MSADKYLGSESYLNNIHLRKIYADGYRQALLDLQDIYQGSTFRYYSKKKDFEIVLQNLIDQREYFIDGDKDYKIKLKRNIKGKVEMDGIAHNIVIKKGLTSLIHLLVENYNGNSWIY